MDMRKQVRTIGPLRAKEIVVSKKRGSIDKPRVFDAEELREILKPIYDRLMAQGVPNARLPSNETLVSHILDWVDDAKVSAWIDGFAKLERKR